MFWKKVGATLFVGLLLPGPAALPAQDRSYRQQALEAARWIQFTRIEQEGHRVWPVTPSKPEVVSNLYSGVPGVVLFFAELGRTVDPSYLADAREGGDYLLAELDQMQRAYPGLYAGLAGIGFALFELHEATLDSRYRRGAARVVKRLQSAAERRGKGLEWNEVTDIIGGTAGIGLFFLYAAEQLHRPGLLKTARRAGDRLLATAVPDSGGSKWAMSPHFQRMMPNFSHGTAGVAYFLARLYEETGEQRFLEGALAGARYLTGIAETTGDVCLVFHHEPEGEELFYLGWCHGPVGTSRLFYQLYRVTGDREWWDWVERSARGIAHSGIPEVQTPGFWNNLGQCCGSAGVGEFFLDLYALTGDARHLEFAQRVAANLMERRTFEPGKGARWVHAEQRVQPDQVAAQTGYMQGAAGIGMFLLHLDAALEGKRPLVVLPDSPYSSFEPRAPRPAVGSGR